MENTNRQTFTFQGETYIQASDIFGTNDQKQFHFFARKIDNNDTEYSFTTTDRSLLKETTLTKMSEILKK